MSTPATASDFSFTDQFDGPVIEPVRYWKPGEKPTAERPRPEPRDVHFARFDMDYWQSWALAIQTQRKAAALARLAKNPPVDATARSRAEADIDRRRVQIFEVFDEQLYPDGIKKILNDSLERAGVTDAKERDAIRRAIKPYRQQQLAAEICSEPRASIEQLREAARALALKLGKTPLEINQWGDEQLIEFMHNFAPPPPQAPGGDAQGEGEAGELETVNPTDGAAPEPGTAPLTGDNQTPSFAPSSTLTPAS
jgi:hypothetical protein